MPVQARCPYCATPCLISEQHLGQMVRCYRCAQVFQLQGASPTTSGSAGSTMDDDSGLPMPSFDDESAAAPLSALDIGTATSAGKVRQRNEDAYFVRRQAWADGAGQGELALVAVVDGMGGHSGGAQASALTVRTIETAFGPFFEGVLVGRVRPEQAAAAYLRGALNKASQAVHAAAQGNGSLKGMGAAAVAALVCPSQTILAHVGDCRAYHFREGKLQQLTKDQTLVQRMLDLGTLKPHEAKQHPARNELSQAIGRRPDVATDIGQVALRHGDWLLLACDGLEEHLSHEELRRGIELALPSAAFLATRLIDVVNERGGRDNCTVIAVRVG